MMNLPKPTLELEVPDDLMKLMWCFETNCVMGCCGIDALDLRVQHAIDGIEKLGLETAEVALEQLEGMQGLVSAHDGPVRAEVLGQGWRGSAEALLFLKKVHASLSAGVNQVKQDTLKKAAAVQKPKR